MRILRYFILLTLISISLLITAGNQKQPRFFVYCKANGDTSAKYARAYERTMASYLKEEFTCCKVVTQADIIVKVERARLNEYLTGEEIGSMCEDFACDYFIALELSDFLSDQVVASAACFFYKKVEPMGRYAKNAPRDIGSIYDVCNNVCKTLVEKIARFEICPFVGKVTLEVNGSKDTTIPSKYSVYCNNFDYAFVKIEKQSSHSVSSWELEKTTKEHAEGTVNFSISESNSLSEENGCYRCQSGREGGRTYYAKSSLDFQSEGLSTESNFDGKEHADARIILEFLPDDTYTITIKATSKTYPVAEEWIVEATGTCDNVPRNTRTETRPLTVFAHPTFGPFPGKATDDFLSQQETKDYYDPVTHEKTIVTIDFNLRVQ